MTRRPFPASIAARLAPATLLVLLAGGCVSLAPDYHRPALPVPATYAAGDSGAEYDNRCRLDANGPPSQHTASAVLR